MLGYVEGYYGRLLTWSERASILDTLRELGMDAYAYAPKEDVRHRLHWRKPYDDMWRSDFRDFCAQAAESGIDIIAGLAPGIDFEFAHLKGGDDLDAACAKLARLREDGAVRLMLLMDDIDADFDERNAGLDSEGVAHARLANRLGELLGESLIVVPRIYAAELALDAPAYLDDFASALDDRHTVCACGPDIVSRHLTARDIHPVIGDEHRDTILWDNLYCNDYCPRKLFVGPWSGRAADIRQIWLNGTGLVETDRLLLALMQAGWCETSGRYDEVLAMQGVPEAFLLVASVFRHPVTNDVLDSPIARCIEPTDEVLAAIDELLWRWKSPLAREWYPFLMSLRHDLLMSVDALPNDRIRKTQTIPLACRLLASGGE